MIDNTLCIPPNKEDYLLVLVQAETFSLEYNHTTE